MKLLLNYKLWIPFILGFSISFLCPINAISNNNITIPQQPPKILFIIIWPILYLLLGFSFVFSDNNIYNFIINILIIILLSLWIPIYSCFNQKLIALYLLPIIIGLIISSIILHKDNLIKISLIPLLIWLFIAFNLSWTKMNNEK